MTQNILVSHKIMEYSNGKIMTVGNILQKRTLNTIRKIMEGLILNISALFAQELRMHTLCMKVLLLKLGSWW